MDEIEFRLSASFFRDHKLANTNTFTTSTSTDQHAFVRRERAYILRSNHDPRTFREITFRDGSVRPSLAQTKREAELFNAVRPPLLHNGSTK